MKKTRIITALMALTLTISLFPTTAHAQNLYTASGWAREGIQQALDKGFVPGNLQSDYTANATRRDFAYLAVSYYEFITGTRASDALIAAGYEVMGRSGGKAISTIFSDTHSDRTIAEAYILGIIGGTQAPTDTTPGRFSPEAPLTREQAAVMVRNVMKALGADISNVTPAGFTDINNVSSWAVDAVNYVRNAGIMSGTSTTPLTFSPKNNYTREQSIITFNNINTDLIPTTQAPTVEAAVIGGINLGFTREQVITAKGEPQRVLPASAGEWLIYRNDDYSNFYMVGVNDNGLVSNIYTTAFNDEVLDIMRQQPGTLLTRYTDPGSVSARYDVPLLWLIGFQGSGFGAVVSTVGCTQSVFELTNAFRGVHDRKPLRWNDSLATAAQTHAEDMNTNQFLSHTGSDGSSPYSRAVTAGYRPLGEMYIGEVAAGGSTTAVQFVNVWVNSPIGHRTSLLHSGREDVGVGISGSYSSMKFGRSQ
jgi:hypothetical protein